MAKKVDGGQHNIDEDPVAKTLVDYLHEQDHNNKTRFRVFIDDSHDSHSFSSRVGERTTRLTN